MKRLLAALSLLLLICAAARAEREITDMAGRTVAIPDGVTRAFGLNTSANTYLLAALPDAMVGWNAQYAEDEVAYLPQPANDLPALGEMEQTDIAALHAGGTQALVYAGALTPDEIERIEQISAAAGLPAICISDALGDIPAALELLGELLAVDVSAQAAYAQEVLAGVREIPPGERVTVYYGYGIDSLCASAPSFEELAAFIGITAVGSGRISPEELLELNPQVILTGGNLRASVSGYCAATGLLRDPVYADIAAVQNGRVYATPNLPYSWIGEPKGVNRLMGIIWLQKKVYPEYCADIDLAHETYRFYRLFYHLDMDGGDVWHLLSRF